MSIGSFRLRSLSNAPPSRDVYCGERIVGSSAISESWLYFAVAAVSGPPHILIKFGDFESTDVVASQAPGIELRTELNCNSANSAYFADQRAINSAPSTPARGRSPVGKEGV